MSEISKVVVEGKVASEKLIRCEMVKDGNTFSNSEGIFDDGAEAFITMMRMNDGTKQLRITVERVNGTFETIVVMENTIIWIGIKDMHVMSKSESALEVIASGVFGL